MEHITFGQEYAGVLLVLFYAFVVHHVWMAGKVTSARKQYKVAYPALYAPPGHAKEKEFNCVQRGHQNSLENLPSFYALLLANAVKWPITTAVLGAIYVTGRIFYFSGYASGDPQARMRGSFMYLGFLPLVVMPVVTAVRLLTGSV